MRFGGETSWPDDNIVTGLILAHSAEVQQYKYSICPIPHAEAVSIHYTYAITYDLKSTLPGILPVQSSILIKLLPISLFLLLSHINNNLRSTLKVYSLLLIIILIFLLKLKLITLYKNIFY